MQHISLAVTSGVIKQVLAGNKYQRQLAIRGASTELQKAIRNATALAPVQVMVNGVFELVVGDTGAIWGKHQSPGLQANDFQNLYELLAQRPNINVKFIWE